MEYRPESGPELWPEPEPAPELWPGPELEPEPETVPEHPVAFVRYQIFKQDSVHVP